MEATNPPFEPQHDSKLREKFAEMVRIGERGAVAFDSEQSIRFTVKLDADGGMTVEAMDLEPRRRIVLAMLLVVMRNWAPGLGFPTSREIVNRKMLMRFKQVPKVPPKPPPEPAPAKPPLMKPSRIRNDGGSVVVEFDDPPGTVKTIEEVNELLSE